MSNATLSQEVIYCYFLTLNTSHCIYPFPAHMSDPFGPWMCSCCADAKRECRLRGCSTPSTLKGQCLLFVFSPSSLSCYTKEILFTCNKFWFSALDWVPRQDLLFCDEKNSLQRKILKTKEMWNVIEKQWKAWKALWK